MSRVVSASEALEWIPVVTGSLFRWIQIQSQVQWWRNSCLSVPWRTLPWTTVNEHDQLMVWAGILLHWKSQLCIVDGFLTAQHYVGEILQLVVVPFYTQIPQGTIFQDNITRAHQGHVVNNYLREHNIELLSWTASFPDLNLINHVLDELGRLTHLKFWTSCNSDLYKNGSAVPSLS